MNGDRVYPKSPIITVGRYAGIQIDKLPNSYLRWMVMQDFPKEWLESAHRKLEQSDYYNAHLSVSRHAIDMFSKRFLHLWNAHIRAMKNEGDGLATFVTKLAQEAWEKGEDVSKNRHAHDGIVKELEGIRFVFAISNEFPEYKDVITVMSSIE